MWPVYFFLFPSLFIYNRFCNPPPSYTHTLLSFPFLVSNPCSCLSYSQILPSSDNTWCVCAKERERVTDRKSFIGNDEWKEVGQIEWGRERWRKSNSPSSFPMGVPPSSQTHCAPCSPPSSIHPVPHPLQVWHSDITNLSTPSGIDINVYWRAGPVQLDKYITCLWKNGWGLSRVCVCHVVIEQPFKKDTDTVSNFTSPFTSILISSHQISFWLKSSA